MGWQIQEGTAPNSDSGLHAFPVSVPPTVSIQCLGSSRERGRGPHSCLAAQGCFSLFSWSSKAVEGSTGSWQKEFTSDLLQRVFRLCTWGGARGCAFTAEGGGAWEAKVGGFGQTLASVTRDQYWAVAPMGSRPPEQMPACNLAATQQKLTAM